MDAVIPKGSGPDRDLSPRQVAEAMGVSESSLKRWCDAGLLATRRTAGGHRRIPIAAVVAFLRAQGFDAARPDLLGMPAGAHRDGRQLSDVAPRFDAALRAGAADDVASILFGLFLAGRSFASLADELIAPAFVALGHAWEGDELEVYQEHRAVEIVTRALHALERMLSAAPDGAPRALAATLAGDPYTLPITLLEVSLREAGWWAMSLGPDHPAPTLASALAAERPTLLCLDVSAVASREDLVRDYGLLADRARPLGVTLALGGRGLDAEFIATLPPGTHFATMTALLAAWGTGGTRRG